MDNITAHNKPHLDLMHKDTHILTYFPFKVCMAFPNN